MMNEINILHCRTNKQNYDFKSGYPIC